MAYLVTSDSYKQLTDAQLWRLFKSGNRKVFAWIYENQVDRLYNYGMQFLCDKQTVADAIQDLFVEIWNRREHLGHTDNIRYYLMRSLRRKLSVFQKEQNRWQFDSFPGLGLLAGILNRHSMDEYYLLEKPEDEMRERMNRAVDLLPLRQKEAIFLVYYEKMPYEEVATIMNVNIKTVYNLVWRGIEHLRKELK